MVEIFKTKDSICSYILFPNYNGYNYKVPHGIFNNLEKYNLKKFGCPSISSVSNKVYNANSYISVEIEFGLKDDEPYYEYELDEKSTHLNSDVHLFMSTICFIQNVNGVVNFQLLSPYALVTDDKELEFTTIMPNMKTENCLYVHGGYRPYYWIRNFNSAWTLKDHSKPGKLFFNIEDPMVSIVFNKSVKLNHIEADKKILDYINQSVNSNFIRKNLSKVYSNALHRRPKRLLKP